MAIEPYPHAPNAWMPANSAQLQRREAAVHLARFEADDVAAKQRDALAVQRYEAIVKPLMAEAERSNSRERWKWSGMSAAIAGTVAGVAAGFVTRSIGVGATLGFGAAIIGALLPVPGRPDWDAIRKRWPQEARAADEAYEVRGRGRHGFELQRARDWDPAGNGGRDVDNALAGVAKFDHDADGAIDLRPGSVELRHDADLGGPVTAATGQVTRLSEDVVAGDADGDLRLTPDEVIIATVRRNIQAAAG